MRHRLLDILACPNDRSFPLRLEVQTAGARPVGGGCCRSYCGRDRAPLQSCKLPADGCEECLAIEIISGRLECPSCGSHFSIEDGIPQLLSASALRHESAKDKAAEMRARDAQVNDYDALRMLSVLSRLEEPAIVAMLETSGADLVLELGAGTGRMTSAVAAHAEEVVAVDFSIESLRRSRAKSFGANVNWVQADINHLPFRDSAADRAFSCQVFEHLPGEEMRGKAVDEAARVIKAGAVFVISVYRDSWFWRLFGPKEGYHPGGIYYFRFSKSEFQNLLAQQFRVDRFKQNVGLYLQIARGVKDREPVKK